ITPHRTAAEELPRRVILHSQLDTPGFAPDVACFKLLIFSRQPSSNANRTCARDSGEVMDETPSLTVYSPIVRSEAWRVPENPDPSRLSGLSLPVSLAFDRSNRLSSATASLRSPGASEGWYPTVNFNKAK